MYKKILYIILLLFILSGCATVVVKDKPVKNRYRYTKGWTQIGMASYYGKKFHNKQMANGKLFNMYALTCAHRKLPFGTKVKVTNLENGKWVIVTVTDRGPFVKGRIIDLSYAAAKEIDMISKGVAKVKVEVIQ